MHPYLPPLVEIFERRANPETAEPMKQYMRGKFAFLGIKSPQRKELQKQFLAQFGLPPVDDLTEITRDLWALPEREYQYIALDLLDRRQKKLTPAHVGLIEHLIVTQSWWDTIDPLATHQVGRLFIAYPDIRDEHIGRWRTSDNIWLRRVTLLFQFPCKANTDQDLLFQLIQENRGSDEFFIQKAIGWALREYSKSNAQAVIDFIDQTDLPPLSHREGLKWLKNQGIIN